MWYRKRKGFRYLVGLVMGVGLAAGMVFLPVMPVCAATQVSSATKTSAVPTLSDDEFDGELTKAVDPDQPIKDVFPDPQLAQAVAKALDASDVGGESANLKNLLVRDKDTLTGDRIFSIEPSVNQAPGTATVSNWTGLSTLKNYFGIVEVKDQPDFDLKAAALVNQIGCKNDVRAEFFRDDLTTTGFNKLVALSDSGFSFSDLDVSDNQVTDFSAINNLYNSGVNAPVTGMRESGSIEESALMVHDGSVVIKGGVPGAELLPQNVLKQNRRVGVLRLETPEQTSSYLKEPASASVSSMPGAEVDSPVTFSKLQALTQVDFNDHEWRNVYPFQYAHYASDFDPSEVTESEQASLNQLDIQGIPDNVDSLMIRSKWANSASGGTYPISTLVKIPLIRENSQSNLPEASTTSSETTSSQASDSSQPTGPNIAKKGQAVYTLKKIGLYRQPTFTKQNRRYFYRRQPRIRRPQFVVTGYAYSKRGVLRYRVRDVNHHSATANRQGYITAQSAYVVKTYYQTAPKKIRVISPHGVNAYRKVNLTGRVKHYRQGQVLRVKKIKTYHLTTRLILSNGRYITANKTLVQEK